MSTQSYYEGVAFGGSQIISNFPVEFSTDMATPTDFEEVTMSGSASSDGDSGDASGYDPLLFPETLPTTPILDEFEGEPHGDFAMTHADSDFAAAVAPASLQTTPTAKNSLPSQTQTREQPAAASHPSRASSSRLLFSSCAHCYRQRCKCDGQRPCDRCKARGRECVDRPADGSDKRKRSATTETTSVGKAKAAKGKGKQNRNAKRAAEAGRSGQDSDSLLTTESDRASSKRHKTTPTTQLAASTATVTTTTHSHTHTHAAASLSTPSFSATPTQSPGTSPSSTSTTPSTTPSLAEMSAQLHELIALAHSESDTNAKLNVNATAAAAAATTAIAQFQTHTTIPSWQ